jgi:hypothetical protein
MLVVDSSGLHLALVVLLVLFFEDIHEEAIVLFEDGVLGRKLKGHSALDWVVEARLGEWADRFVSVEHAEVATSISRGLELVDELGSGLRSVSGGELKLDFSRFGDDVVLATVLISIGMTANNNGLGPAGNKARNVLNNNGLTEDSAVKNVADSAVRGFPHLLEAKLFNTASIGGDGSALDSALGTFHGLGAVNGNLVVGLITVLNGEVVVLGGDFNVGVDVLILDPLPDDLGHLITINIDDSAGDTHFLKEAAKLRWENLSIIFIIVLAKLSLFRSTHKI